MKGAPEKFTSLVSDGNQCFADVIEKYEIKDEVKSFMNVVFSDEWIQTVEFGNADDFKKELAFAIDPVTKKVIGISGEDFANNMSFELSEWIKDTTLLWIKNKGAGQTTASLHFQHHFLGALSRLIRLP